MHAAHLGTLTLRKKWYTSVTFQFDAAGVTQGSTKNESASTTHFLNANKTSNNLCSRNCVLENGENILPLSPKLHTAYLYGFRKSQ
jgi:hypothetical protein